MNWTTKEKKHLALVLKTLREVKGFTRKHIADQLKITERTIQRWDNNDSLPSPAICSNIQNYLNEVAQREETEELRKMLKGED